jgi:hypothetical protein
MMINFNQITNLVGATGLCLFYFVLILDFKFLE